MGNPTIGATCAAKRQAAEQTVAAYQIYQLDDRRIRALNTAADLREAIRVDTTFAPADSNGAYTSYDTALVKRTGINQQAFDGA